MATELLHCCICPKQPNFSDASHLLTHISSKGHLAHLHKLQVRSHQEAAAGQQLAVYDQWFVGHNVAYLLSERLQLKEKKQARLRADNRHRNVVSKQESPPKVDPKLCTQDSQPRALSQTFPLRQEIQHSNSDAAARLSLIGYSDHSPSRYSRSYVGMQDPTEFDWPVSNDRCNTHSPTSTHPGQDEESRTPEVTRLKGIVWPGMAIFDSADEETQRKRNQRKDTSVLRRMQAMSELIEPMETVCSPGGTIKKKRHMDDIESDSLVDGESPLMKPIMKRQRKPSGSTNAGEPRPSVRRSRATRTALRPAITPVKHVSTVSSRNDAQSRQQAQIGQAVDTKSNFAHPFPHRRKKRSAFAVFEDEQSDGGLQTVAMPNPLLTDRTNHATRTSNIPPSSSCSHATLAIDRSHDPFEEHISTSFWPDRYGGSSKEKENINPLFWQQGPKVTVASPLHSFYGRLVDFDDTFDSLAEVYAFNKNPLLHTTPLRNPLGRSPTHMQLGSIQEIEDELLVFH